MTLIHTEPPGAFSERKGRLHALIIGVADYPHLVNGRGAKAYETFQLEQVSHPKPSAKEIAHWFLNEYQNRETPLGSVELLVSPGETFTRLDGTEVTVDPATFENIETAAKEWRARCDSDPANHAFFYFCGHGMSKVTQFLLPEDFANPAGYLWKNCIDFDTFVSNMRACAARTQLFFVDACRNRPERLHSLKPQGSALVDGDDDARKPTSSLVFYATADEDVVHLPAESPITSLAEAFLKAMRGGAAAKKETWRVTLLSLAGPLHSLVIKVAARYRLEQTAGARPEGKDVLLHEIDTPVIFTEIDCQPALAQQEASIQLVSDMHSHPPRTSTAGNARPWYDNVELGTWQLSATFTSYASYEQTVEIDRPFFEWMIER